MNVQHKGERKHVAVFYPLCIEYLASGESLLLKELSEFHLSDTSSFHAIYITKFTGDIGQLCDSLNSLVLLKRLGLLMKNVQVADFFKAKVLQHPRISPGDGRIITENLTKSESRKLFWLRFLCEFRESMTFHQAQMFHGFKRAIAIGKLVHDSSYSPHMTMLSESGVSAADLDEFWMLLFRSTPFWLGTRDYKFFDLVEKAPGGFDRLLACNMDWGQFSNRYTSDILAPKASPRSMHVHVKLVIEGMLRGVFDLQTATSRFERFLASDKPAMHFSVKQLVDESFLRLSSLERGKYPALLELLAHYRFFPGLLPHFEACESFAEGLRMTKPEVAARIISHSAMKEQLLQSYPESRENVLVMDLGL